MKIFEILLTEVSNDVESINEEDKEAVCKEIYNGHRSNSKEELD